MAKPMKAILKSGILCLCLLLSGLAALAQDPAKDGFAAWLKALKAEALSKGISSATLDAALKDVAPIERIVELDRKQPEFTQTFQDYMTARVTPARIDAGRQRMAENRTLLSSVSKAEGVQARFIAAIWGMETNYGRFMGSFEVVPALVTLAYDPRRSDYFRSELINALKILDEGHIGVHEMKGSWAGAMGQGQFMPSSFLVFAKDFDGDGRKDIWGNPGDVFASIANYLRSHGWRDDQTWGRQVRLPAGFDAETMGLALPEPPKSCQRALKDHTRQIGLAEWQALGVRRADGRDLPALEMKASLVQPAGKGGPAFLTYENYRSILRYNCSNFYAIAVGSLADQL